MATQSTATALAARPRDPEGSRATRRLRRTGRVPGVLYGGGGESLAFDVDARELRLALAGSGAVLDLTIEGASPESVVVKDEQRHPVRGETMHIDLIRVDLNVAIEATVALHLHDVEEAPGVKAGGVLEQVTRELTVEALPNEIPEEIVYAIGPMEIGDTITLEQISAPAGVKIIDDSETVIATLSPPRLEIEPEEEIETETELVGEEGAEGEAVAETEGAEGDAEAAPSDES